MEFCHFAVVCLASLVNLLFQEEIAQGVNVTTTLMCATQQLENASIVSTTRQDFTVNAVKMEHGAMPHNNNAKVKSGPIGLWLCN